jgi:hypothetical protein
MRNRLRCGIKLKGRMGSSGEDTKTISVFKRRTKIPKQDIPGKAGGFFEEGNSFEKLQIV